MTDYSVAAASLQDRERRKQELLDRLRNRRDAVSHGRVISSQQAERERVAEEEEYPVQETQSRIPSGEQIVRSPDLLRDVLLGGMRLNPRSMIANPPRPPAIESPQSMIRIMAGSFRKPSVQNQPRAGDRINSFAAGLLGRKRRRS